MVSVFCEQPTASFIGMSTRCTLEKLDHIGESWLARKVTRNLDVAVTLATKVS